MMQIKNRGPKAPDIPSPTVVSWPRPTHKLIFSDNDATEFDLQFAEQHYIIYPWIADSSGLLRVFTTDTGAPILAKIYRGDDSKNLFVDIYSEAALTKNILLKERAELAFCLGLGADYRLLREAAKGDEILSTALRFNKGIRPKRYSTIFEAVCGAICAQNVDFRRLYSMMELLCKSFGRCLRIANSSYWAFPTPYAIAAASEDDLRQCKVGYRASRLWNAASWFCDHGQDLDRQRLKAMPLVEALTTLCQIPGLGPYSAAIVLRAGAGREDIFQLDSFTRHILRTLYKRDELQSDSEIRAFIATRWAGFAGSVAHLLTTNTHMWAADLGYQDFRRSAAKVPRSRTKLVSDDKS